MNADLELAARLRRMPIIGRNFTDIHNKATDTIERLQSLINEHHNVRHWLDGTEAQHRVGLALWGTPCAVCAALASGDTGTPSMIPVYAMLDVWMALGGSPAAFDRMWAEDRRTPADTWAQLMAMIRGNYEDLLADTNPPIGPEFEALVFGDTGTPQDAKGE